MNRTLWRPAPPAIGPDPVTGSVVAHSEDPHPGRMAERPGAREPAGGMSKLFTLTTVAAGAAVGMIVAGILAIAGGSYAHKVVHDQLVPQKIFFSADASELPAKLKPYAGEQVDTAKEAKVFAEDYIGLHLQGVAKGQTYSEVSGQFMKDPNNQQLAQQRQTLFMGETLRGMLPPGLGLGHRRDGGDDRRRRPDRPRRPAARHPADRAPRRAAPRPGGCRRTPRRPREPQPIPRALTVPSQPRPVPCGHGNDREVRRML